MRIHVDGVNETLLAFLVLPVRMKFKHLRIALNAAAGVIRNRARQVVLKSTRLLANSLSVKVKIPDASHNPKHWGKPEYAVIGPARRVSQAVTQTARGSFKILRTRKAIFNAALRGAIIRRRTPSRYAHIVERGSKHQMAFPYLDTAVRTEGATAGAKALAKLQQGLAQEAAALAATP